MFVSKDDGVRRCSLPTKKEQAPVNVSLTVFISGVVVLEVLLVLLVMTVLIVPVLVVPVEMAVLVVLVMMAELEVLLVLVAMGLLMVPVLVEMDVLVVLVTMAVPDVLLVLVAMGLLMVPVLVVPVTMAVLDVLDVTGSSRLRTNIVTTTAALTATNPKNKSPIIANFPRLIEKPATASFSSLPESSSSSWAGAPPPPIRTASQTGIVMTLASARGSIRSRPR